MIVRVFGTSRPLLALLIAAVIIAYPIAAFYPYDWLGLGTVPNTARPLPSGGVGFTSPGPGVARTAGPPAWLAAAIQTHRIEVLLRVRPATLDQTGPARILTLSAGTKRRNLTVAQDGGALVVRLRTPWHDDNGIPPTIMPRVFSASRWVDVRLAVAPGDMLIEVDGAIRARVAIPEAPFEGWDSGYALALGNELTNNRPWAGDIARAEVRVGTTAIDYGLPGALEIPPRLWHPSVPPPNFVPFFDAEPTDLIVNFVGFVPLGLLLGVLAYRRGARGVAGAIGLITLVSLALEIGQLGLPARYPSITDWILNSAGGALGVDLGRRLGLRRSPFTKGPAP